MLMIDPSVLNDVRDQAIVEYIAEDGLMRLYKDDSRDSYAEDSDLSTVANDNGVLFTAYFYALLERRGYKLKAEDMDIISRALTTTRHAKHPGLYHRNDGRLDSLNSLDNYVGIMALSALSKDSTAKEIVAWGENNRWTFNNVSPEKWTWSAWRQPSHVALYKIVAGFEPSKVEWVWLYASTWVNALQKFEARGDLMLEWLMEFSIAKVRPTEQLTVRHQMSRQTMKRHGGVGSLMTDYFLDPDHPCRLLSDGLDF